jgi:nicotinamidase-related amidase
MPLTQLDSKPALIVIDLQKGIVSFPLAQPSADIVGRSAQLAKVFRERDLPAVLVNVTGRSPGRTDAGRPAMSFPPDWTDLVPELEQQPSDILVSKQSFGALIGTGLHEKLRDLDVTQIFLAGIATSGGVEATARSAYDYGYNVVFVVDAMTDRDAEVQRACVEKIFPRLGECDTTEAVLHRLRS